MGQPAAKQNDRIIALDIHLVQPPWPGPPLPLPHIFSGIIDAGLSSDVNIQRLPAATQDSTATNTPSHIPLIGSFVNPPKNQGRITRASATVFINKKPAARLGDTATTCSDPTDLPLGVVVAAGPVLIGG